MSRITGIFLVVALIGSLGLNFAIVGVTSVAVTASAMAEGLLGTPSVLTETRQRAEAAEGQVDVLEAERQTLQARIAALSTELETADGKVAALQADLTARSADVTRLGDEVAQRDAHLAALQDDLRQKTSRIDWLTDRIDSQRATDAVTYRGSDVLLKEAILDTNARVSNRVATAAARNASAVVAEAIPIIGIAAMLGVTAYDLRDSCDTIRDLHALDVALDPARALPDDAAEVCGLEVPTQDEVWAAVKSNAREAWDEAATHLPDLPEFALPSVKELIFWR